MINAVVFDLDGTLINLPVDYDELFQEFSKVAKGKNIRPLTKILPKLEETVRKRIFAIWNKAESEAFTNATINTKGMALYEKFRTEPKALVTMQGKLLVQKFLNNFSLSFDFVITRENSLDRVEQLKIAAEKLKVPFENMLFIGNTDDDLSAAKKLGCQFLKVEK